MSYAIPSNTDPSQATPCILPRFGPPAVLESIEFEPIRTIQSNPITLTTPQGLPTFTHSTPRSRHVHQRPEEEQEESRGRRHAVIAAEGGQL